VTRVLYPAGDGLQICALLHEAEEARGNAVLAHGITVDKDESGQTLTGVGAFVELADALQAARFNVLRFDYRGHGASEGAPEEMTLAGELLDLAASVDRARARWPLPTALVAASFGAASAVACAAGRDDLACVVLWNPVLDLQKTFVASDLPWAQEAFGPDGMALLEQRGYLELGDLDFRIGRPLVEEMQRLRPFEHVPGIRCPVLTLHGDRDTRVPYEVARQHARCNEQSRFVTVPGAEHGFREPEERAFVIPRTVKWIERFVGG
jgi:pimeloyl-ACP methyl ester carboxylesterase